MENRKCVAVHVPGRPDPREAEHLARCALSEGEDWGALEVEIFPGREDTLLLIHPAEGVYIDRSAVRFLLDRFGD